MADVGLAAFDASGGAAGNERSGRPKGPFVSMTGPIVSTPSHPIGRNRRIQEVYPTHGGRRSDLAEIMFEFAWAMWSIPSDRLSSRAENTAIP